MSHARTTPVACFVAALTLANAGSLRAAPLGYGMPNGALGNEDFFYLAMFADGC